MFYKVFKKDVRDESEIVEYSEKEEKVLKELLAFTRAGLSYKKIGAFRLYCEAYFFRKSEAN